jgi:hypothetical protein
MLGEGASRIRVTTVWADGGFLLALAMGGPSAGGTALVSLGGDADTDVPREASHCLCLGSVGCKTGSAKDSDKNVQGVLKPGGASGANSAIVGVKQTESMLNGGEERPSRT